MDNSNFFITSPNKYSLNANMLNVSPFKTEVTFSPMKESSLSPFKLLNQSPSKGSFDDWDKDFLEGFEENLFGMMNDMSESTVGELLKSPKGKALLEKGRASADLNVSPVGKIRISSFQRPLTDNKFSENEQRDLSDVMVKQEPTESYIMKQENVENDHVYGQTYVYVNTNGALSAIDPDKMSATPIKPRHTHLENAPKRKLAMRVTNSVNQAIVFQSDQDSLNFHANKQTVWPSKERLNFARLQFREVLNSAVEKERQILKELKMKNGKSKNKSAEQTQISLPQKAGKVKATGGKSRKTGAGKGKGKSKKGTKKDRYPEISMALSKPVTVKKKARKSMHRHSTELDSELDDLSVYTDDEFDDEVDDSGWDSRPPFYTQMSTGFDVYSDGTSDDEWTEPLYKYRRVSGSRVAAKKRKR